ncbi:hypothetical protein LTR78_010333 [Recurvomyces mirabilis]|uniref:Mitochondrial outer membrane protein OM14 C-terminal domain-containing protein n=1 Tax=Recurvomyces mirabilis TaxID=574656 RepID=A0AAE0WI13_9PEZI|nr:hypothetical protein LTR78_010333 [Recurvomyces mirabilis]KAK5156226.1 hypothetical protein LTS14_005113 [Recurvomyces mirabilis]
MYVSSTYYTFDQEEIPDTVPEITHSDSGVHTIGGGNHENSIPSYSDQQKAQETRDSASAARDQASASFQNASDTAKASLDQASQDAKAFMTRAESGAKKTEAQGAKKYQNFTKEAGNKDWEKLSKDAQKQYQQLASEAGEEWEDVKVQSKKAGEKAKKEGKEAERWADKNKGNPVVVGNLVVVAAMGALLGTGGYRMHKAGRLTWKVAGAWAGAVGLFAVGDYFVSQWLFRNKYPPKN